MQNQPTGTCDCWLRYLTPVILIRVIAIDRRSQPEATGNGEDLAGSISRRIAGKVADGFRNFLRQTYTAQWNVSQEQSSEIVRQMFFHGFGGGHTGENGVTPDMVLGLLHSD